MRVVETPRMIGLEVSRARKAGGITQEQLARACGVSRQLVNRLEVGTATGIGLEKLLKVLSYLGLNLYIDSELDAENERGSLDENPTESTASSNDTVDQGLVSELLERYSLDKTLFLGHNEE